MSISHVYQFPGATAQPSELQMDLAAITSAPSESMIEEGPQFEVKALPLSRTWAGLSRIKKSA